MTTLRRYTDTLWSTMQPELREVFGYCYGFETVTCAERLFPLRQALPGGDDHAVQRLLAGGRRREALRDAGAHREDRAGALAAGGIVAAWLATLLLGALLPDGPLREWAAFFARWGLLAVPLMLAGAALYPTRSIGASWRGAGSPSRTERSCRRC